MLGGVLVALLAVHNICTYVIEYEEDYNNVDVDFEDHEYPEDRLQIPATILTTIHYGRHFKPKKFGDHSSVARTLSQDEIRDVKDAIKELLGGRGLDRMTNTQKLDPTYSNTEATRYLSFSGLTMADYVNPANVFDNVIGEIVDSAKRKGLKLKSRDVRYRPTITIKVMPNRTSAKRKLSRTSINKYGYRRDFEEKTETETPRTTEKIAQGEAESTIKESDGVQNEESESDEPIDPTVAKFTGQDSKGEVNGKKEKDTGEVKETAESQDSNNAQENISEGDGERTSSASAIEEKTSAIAITDSDGGVKSVKKTDNVLLPANQLTFATVRQSSISTTLTTTSRRMTRRRRTTTTTTTARPTTTDTPGPEFDIPALVDIIANLTYDLEANITDLFNQTLQKYKIPTCKTPTPSTTEMIIHDLVNASVVAKCYVCGFESTGIPQDARCADAFAGDFLPLVPVDQQARGKIARYKKYCRYMDVNGVYVNATQPRSLYGRFTGGCSVRWTDLSGVYTQRACRSTRRAMTGRHFASKRMAKLEMALKEVDNGCIISPMASLLPLSRGISLFARFHACVCTGSWCNSAMASEQWFTCSTIFTCVIAQHIVSLILLHELFGK